MLHSFIYNHEAQAYSYKLLADIAKDLKTHLDRIKDKP